VKIPTFAGLLGSFVATGTSESFCDHCLVVKLSASLREIRSAVSVLVETEEFHTEVLTCGRCLERTSILRHCV
jgi:hypothetical protein